MFFRTPPRILVAGPSGSGKTVFVSKLLREPHRYFRHLPADRIHYCYSVWQPLFDTLQQQGVHFHRGIPDLSDLATWFGKTKTRSPGGLLIMDDLMDEGSNDKRVLDLFTRDSHHRNITVVYLIQDLFPPGKYAKTISRNAHYIVAFKNPRDQTGIRILLQQMFPLHWRHALEVYNKATSRPFGYLMLDLHPAADDQYRLYTNLLQDEGYTHTYRRRTDEPTDIPTAFAERTRTSTTTKGRRSTHRS